jgi:hypothetical protein
MPRPCPRLLVALLLVALGGLSPARAEEARKVPTPDSPRPAPLPATRLPLDLARDDERRGAQACALSACACGAGQCWNGEGAKGVLVGAAGGLLVLASMTLLTVISDPGAVGVSRAPVLAGLAAVNLTGFGLWAWSLADAYLTGAKVTFPVADAPTPVVRAAEADGAR